MRFFKRNTFKSRQSLSCLCGTAEAPLGMPEATPTTHHKPYVGVFKPTLMVYPHYGSSGGRRLSASLPLLLARPQTTRMASGRRRRTQTTRITKNDSEYEGGDGDVYSGSAEIGFQLECEHVIRGSIWHEGEHDFTKRHLWRAVAIGQLQWARIGEECRVTRSCVWRGAHWVA